MSPRGLRQFARSLWLTAPLIAACHRTPQDPETEPANSGASRREWAPTGMWRSPPPSGPTLRVVLPRPLAALEAHAPLKLDPAPVAVRLETGSEHVVELELPPGAQQLELSHPALCGARFAVPELRPAVVLPLFTLEPAPQVGFDAPFALVARPRCPEAEPLQVTWRQLSGRHLELKLEADGRRANGRTRGVDPRLLAKRTGLLPLSPATRGEAWFEARWERDGVVDRERVLLSSAARSTGLPSVPLEHRQLLAGRAWRVRDAPPPDGPSAPAAVAGERGLSATATRERRAPDGAERVGDYELRGVGAFTEFVPHRAGTWKLVRGRDELDLRVMALDATPLDCARADCHAAVGTAYAQDPMRTVFARGLWRKNPPHPLEASGDRLQQGLPPDVTCVDGCHVLGERGLDDGGFFANAERMGWHAYEIDARPHPPRALARTAGVTCLACHGPGTIPPPASRIDVLRSDVCATCHDAPPRYGHVQAWTQSKMSAADASPETRSRAECRGCHTTAGFLAAIGARPLATSDEGLPAMGIACAACHAPHASAHTGPLLRVVPLPPRLERAGEAWKDSPTAVCFSCHAASADTPWAFASAASVWLGASAEPATPPVPGPHGALEGGCLGCHTGAPSEATAGTNHTFGVDRARCTSCHAAGIPEVDATSAGEADRLLRGAIARGWLQVSRTASGSPHALATGWQLSAQPTQAQRRVLQDLAAVLADRAAGYHNPEFVRRTLSAVQRELSGVSGGLPPSAPDAGK